MPRARRKPSYCHHRPTGQAYCRIDGRMVYLGAWDTPDSRSRYESEVEAWSLRQNPKASMLTIDDLVLRYLKHCETYYRTPEGRDTGETSNVKAACRYVVRECGTVRV